MKHRILLVLTSLLGMATASFAQQPVSLVLGREEFLREVLSSKPSARTLYYNTGLPGSYQISKTDVVGGLTEMAKRQNLDLRGLLIIGPYGPTNVTFVYVFTKEKTTFRVNQLTVADSRFTYKSTGTLTAAKYNAFFNGLIRANVLTAGMPKGDAASEARHETLLVRWSAGNSDSYYGSMINPRPGAKINEFGKLIGQLLHSLTKTYPLPISAPGTRP